MNDLRALLAPIRERTQAVSKKAVHNAAFGDVLCVEWTTYYFGADLQWHNARTGQVKSAKDVADAQGFADGDWEWLAHGSTDDRSKLLAAVESIIALPHEDYCCTKGCPGFGLATCGKVHKNGDECDGKECSCFLSGPLNAVAAALGSDTTNQEGTQ